MTDYRVQLEAYAGPLDLLLYLVKRHEIDLHDIPIAQLTEQYLEHLRLIQELTPSFDMDKAGEFLVMAATLLEIKSQMLMPRPDDAEGEGDAQDVGPDRGDPRLELVQQLLAYKRYKDAARQLEHRHDEWASRYAIHPVTRPKPRRGEGEAEPIEIDLDDVNVLDLCQAFARMLDSIGHNPQHQVTYDDTPISLHAEDIRDRLEREGPMTLQKMFEGRRSRSEMIGLFLATLELVREHKVRVLQDQVAGEISLELRPEADQAVPGTDEAADWRDPETGEMQYDWPDEQGRRRAERRARLRAKRAGELGDEEESFDSDEEDDPRVDEEEDEEPFDPDAEPWD